MSPIATGFVVANSIFFFGEISFQTIKVVYRRHGILVYTKSSLYLHDKGNNKLTI